MSDWLNIELDRHENSRSVRQREQAQALYALTNHSWPATYARLRELGWSDVEIGQAMGQHPTTVANVLRRNSL